jgi:Zn-dependent protease with chaperone function
MTVPYSLRLVYLCLATFFLVHLAAGLVVSLLASAAVRLAGRTEPRRAARLLLALRLLPVSLAVFVVASLCVPSYLWLEPDAAVERMGWGFLTAAALGAAVWSISLARGVRAAVRSRRYLRHCRSIGVEARLPGDPSSVWVVDGAATPLALGGFIRPRLVVSRPVLNALSRRQLAAALRHERAHGAARDNLKRLLILLAPGVLPFFHGFESLERGWVRFTEWAADDWAVAGNPRHSLSLAAALVRVARMSTLQIPPPLTTSLLGDGLGLSARVDRLLRTAPPAEPLGRAFPACLAFASLAVACALAATMLQPSTLYTFHLLLEHLIG